MFVCVLVTMLGACAQPKPKLEEAAAPPPLPAPEASPAEVVQTPPPQTDEVKQAINRVFKDAATISSEHKPTFVAGDFNGDRSPDIAVVLIPAFGKLSEMNQKYPPWILKSIFATDRPGGVAPAVAENEALLAVIHGYGDRGWRDAQATQTFLLKSAALTNMQTQERASFLKLNAGKKLPRLHGDLIRGVLKQKSGWLYFAEATYKWYDPESFKGEPEKRVVHPGVPVPMANKAPQ